jgi:hypothetical protein
MDIGQRAGPVLTGAETGDETAFAFVGPVRWLSNGGWSLAMSLEPTPGLRYRRPFSAIPWSPRRRTRRVPPTRVGHRRNRRHAPDARPSLRRLSFWHAGSGFLRSVSLADGGSLESFPADAWPWRDSLIVVFQLATTPQESVPPSSGPRRWPMRAHLTIRDITGRILRTSPTFNAMYSGLDERVNFRLPFSNRPFAAASHDRV